MILEDVEYLWQCMSEGFRLLNSEIGNDQFTGGIMMFMNTVLFSSP